jgi:AraC-like DNA-binding protein
MPFTKDQMRVYMQGYRLEHGDRLREEDRKRRSANPGKYHARAEARRAAQRQQFFTLLGDICARCGFSDQRALQIDHINGGGSAELRRWVTPYAYYKDILRRVLAGEGGFQILCANCNAIKRMEEDRGR